MLAQGSSPGTRETLQAFSCGVCSVRVTWGRLQKQEASRGGGSCYGDRDEVFISGIGPGRQRGVLWSPGGGVPLGEESVLLLHSWHSLRAPPRGTAQFSSPGVPALPVARTGWIQRPLEPLALSLLAALHPEPCTHTSTVALNSPERLRCRHCLMKRFHAGMWDSFPSLSSVTYVA